MYESDAPSQVEPASSPENDMRFAEFREELRSQQSLMLGVVMGLGAALVSAAAWAAVTYWTGYQIGWLAIGVGFLVGITVRKFGRGTEPVFGVVGAMLSLAGCALGNVLASCAFAAKHENVGLLEVLNSVDLEVLTAILKGTIDPFGLLFYGLAAFEGFRLSFVRIDEAALRAAVQVQQP